MAAPAAGKTLLSSAQVTRRAPENLMQALEALDSSLQYDMSGDLATQTSHLSADDDRPGPSEIDAPVTLGFAF